MTQHYTVPEEGLRAVWDVWQKLHLYDNIGNFHYGSLRECLEAFIRWQDEKIINLVRQLDGGSPVEREAFALGHAHAIEDMRRMYLAPEPQDPAFQAVHDAIGRRIGKGSCQVSSIVAEIVKAVDDARAQKVGRNG